MTNKFTGPTGATGCQPAANWPLTGSKSAQYLSIIVSKLIKNTAI